MPFNAIDEIRIDFFHLTANTHSVNTLLQRCSRRGECSRVWVARHFFIYQHHWNSASAVTTCYNDNHTECVLPLQKRIQGIVQNSFVRAALANRMCIGFDLFFLRHICDCQILVGGFIIYSVVEFMLVFSVHRACPATNPPRQRQSQINKIRFGSAKNRVHVKYVGTHWLSYVSAQTSIFDFEPLKRRCKQMNVMPCNQEFNIVTFLANCSVSKVRLFIAGKMPSIEWKEPAKLHLGDKATDIKKTPSQYGKSIHLAFL